MQPGLFLATCSAAPIPAPEGSVPEWVHLLPAGTIGTVDGRGPYRVTSMSAVAELLPPGGKLPIDENHATDKGAATGQPAPARGWIDALQARPDGLWGRVEWTRAGRQLVADKAYAGISPVILHNAAGEIVQVLRASLTNTPNLKGLTTLHSQTPQNGAPLLGAADRRVIALLGLSEAEYTASLRAQGLRREAMSVANGGKDKRGLDAADRHVIALMGLSEDEYLATQSRLGLKLAAL